MRDPAAIKAVRLVKCQLIPTIRRPGLREEDEEEEEDGQQMNEPMNDG